MAYAYAIQNGCADADGNIQIHHLVPREYVFVDRPGTPPPDESLEGTVLERAPEPPMRPCTPERLPFSPSRKPMTQRARQAKGVKRLKGPEAGTRPSKAATGKRKREEDAVACEVVEDAEMEEDAEFEADVEMVEAMEAMGAVEVEEKGKVGAVGAGRAKGGPKKQARLSFAKSA